VMSLLLSTDCLSARFPIFEELSTGGTARPFWGGQAVPLWITRFLLIYKALASLWMGREETPRLLRRKKSESPNLRDCPADASVANQANPQAITAVEGKDLPHFGCGSGGARFRAGGTDRVIGVIEESTENPPEEAGGPFPPDLRRIQRLVAPSETLRPPNRRMAEPRLPRGLESHEMKTKK
jgi:hypothetical protein